MNTLNTLLSQLIKSYVGPAILHLFIWIKKTIRMSVDCEVIDSNFIGYVCKFPKKEKKNRVTFGLDCLSYNKLLMCYS